jgi:hypothetical protein
MQICAYAKLPCLQRGVAKSFERRFMGGLKINDSNSWLVAGWVHAYTRDLALKHLPPDAPEELRKALLEDQQSGLEFVLLQRLAPESMRKLLETVDRIAELLNSGGETFGTPAILPEYLNRLGELRQALQADPRLGVR